MPIFATLAALLVGAIFLMLLGANPLPLAARQPSLCALQLFPKAALMTWLSRRVFQML
jgi:hypothetical protein